MRPRCCRWLAGIRRVGVFLSTTTREGDDESNFSCVFGSWAMCTAFSRNQIIMLSSSSASSSCPSCDAAPAPAPTELDSDCSAFCPLLL